MTEHASITCNIKNESGNKLTVFYEDLGQGKFEISPTEIFDGEIGQFEASGRKGSATGTHGTVEYQAFDGTLFIIKFKINAGPKENSVSWTTTTDAGRGNPSHFDFYRTASNYITKNTSGDPGHRPATVYFYLGKNKT
ncbi:MAG TPA: hypothetical protein VLL98_03420 [Rickettsiales bacterium]|nr:hypothetical protein [Rickettsiales bacterium]